MYQLKPTLTGWSPVLMSLLSLQISQKFEQTGEAQNLDEAIDLHQRAIEARTDKPLGTAYEEHLMVHAETAGYRARFSKLC